MTAGPAADSAGTRWVGRSFEANAWAGDDGTAPAGFVDAVAALQAGRGGADAVLDTLREARLLVPLVADLAEAATTDGNRVHDKRAELALPTVSGPDGRPVLPAFSSAAAMAAWRPGARPVPAPARQVALGAAADGTELVVIDPGSRTVFGLRRSAVEALARSLPWIPPWQDPEVRGAVRTAAEAQPEVVAARVGAGDPLCSLEQAELVVTLVLSEPLGREALAEVLERIRTRWAADAVVAWRVDSVAVRFEAGAGGRTGRAEPLHPSAGRARTGGSRPS